MQRITLPINEIKVEDRQRIDLGNVADLANSLSRYGLIQPIVVNQDRRLVAGGRRLAAATQLGWTTIDVVYRETLTVDELHELELEENVRRKNMSWQEEALTIAKIHHLKARRSALDGSSWGIRQTSELFGGMAVGTVHYVLRVAKLLKEELAMHESLRRAWNCTSIADCWKNVILRDEQAALHAELARRAQEDVDKKAAETKLILDDFAAELDAAPLVETISTDDKAHILALRERARNCYLDLNVKEAETLYLSNPLNPPERFQEYYDQKRQWWTQHLTLDVTQTFFRGDCISYMTLLRNESAFDHIITDIPYGIDMDMLSQQNPHSQMRDIDTVTKEHDVQSNMSLMQDFFPAAFYCLKDSGFLITWCDIMQWQFMYDLAIKAGFRVQRWPITWVKTHTCLNQSAQYNFTKTTEIAIVCRKPNAVLCSPQMSCVIEASNTDTRKLYSHPFAKPFAVWKFLIEAVSIEGQTILEPFAGHGSGVIPMLQLKRKVFGVEINKTHFNALIENVKQHYLTLNPRFILT